MIMEFFKMQKNEIEENSKVTIMPNKVSILCFTLKMNQSKTIDLRSEQKQNSFNLLIDTNKNILISLVKNKKIIFIYKNGPENDLVSRSKREEDFIFETTNKQISILQFTTEVLEDYIHEGDDLMIKSFLQKSKFEYIFNDTSLMAKMYIQKLKKNKEKNIFNNLTLHANCLTLICESLKVVYSDSAKKELGVIPKVDLQKINLANEYINFNMVKLPTIKEIAKYVGLSESKLKKQFKIIYGKSIYQYGQYLRVKEAQRLLSTKKYNVTEVALKVGYTNITHFANAFKKYHGIKPIEYLKQ